MTSPDVPRRPRPGQAKRVRAALNSTGVHSAEGATAAARAVHPPGGAQIYQPPGFVPGDRMSVFATFAAAALTGTHTRIHAWDGTADAAGTSIQLNSPDDGGLYLFTKGMYAITTSLKVDGLLAAAGTFSIVVLTGASEFPNVGVCSARGGDAAIDEWAASSSQTYYSPGTGFSGGIFVDLDYTAIDPSIVSVSVAVDVALVSA